MNRVGLAMVVALLAGACSPGAADSAADQPVPGTPSSTGGVDSATSALPVSFPAVGTPGGLDGWTAIELPEATAAATGTMVGTGTELVFWGGEDASPGAPGGEPGLALDLDSLVWRTLPPSPKQATTGAAAVWTGEEVVFCCGVAGSIQTTGFDPGTDTWWPLAESPPLAPFAEAVWTGTSMLVASRTGVAAYDPENDRWRLFSDPPKPLGRFNRVAWTGAELVVWNAETTRKTFAGMALDPGEGAWRRLPEPAAWPAAPDVVWAGTELIIWGGLPAKFGGESARAVGARYDVSTDQWSDLPEALPEPEACECNIGGQTLLWTGDDLLVSTGYFGTGVDRSAPLLLAFDPAASSWGFLGNSPFGSRAEAIVTGERVVVRSDRLYVSEPGWRPAPEPIPPGGLVSSKLPQLPIGGPELPGAPGLVAARRPLPYCGAAIAALADLWEFEGLIHDGTAAGCFADRVERGLDAELATVEFTVEGDAIVSLLRTQHREPIEVFTDTTRNRVGSGAWMMYSCSSYAAASGQPSECTPPTLLDA